MDDPPRHEDVADLVGRTAELTVVSSFLALARADGDALLLTGEPGVGKTALLEQASRTATADGARVLRAAGVEFEADVSFAALNQLLIPLHDEMPGLPRLHRDALLGSLGLGDEPSTGLLVVSSAVLALLHTAARERPVLLVVDDLQWLDRSSARVLGFVARRARGSRIGFLAAARTQTDSLLLSAGLRLLDLGPLDDAAATALLRTRYPALVSAVRRRVLTVAQGNPLALLELPAALTAAQLRGDSPLPPVLPLTGQLQRLFTGRVRDLPAGTRQLLLLLALDGTGDLRALRAAVPDDRWLEDLGPAERDGLLGLDTSAARAAFRHPLVGVAAVELATSAERRRAHALLAETLTDDDERRAWHLAEAALAPDDSVAALLERTAHRSLRKGDSVGAVQSLLRAAELSPRGVDRARRLSAAAYVGADVAGQLGDVPHRLGDAQRADPDGGSLEATVAAAYQLLNGEGDVATAQLLLARAVGTALDQGRTGPALEDALHSLMQVCHYSGRSEAWQDFRSALGRLGPLASPGIAVPGRICADAATASAPDLASLDGLIAGAAQDSDPSRILRVAVAAQSADRVAACRPALWRVVRNGRDGGAATSAVGALMLLCHEYLRDGRWEEAARAADEGIAWGERLGYRLTAVPGIYCRALLAAARGDEPAIQGRTEELLAWAAPRGAVTAAHFAHRARGLAALGRGDFEAAFAHATAINAPGTLTNSPVGWWSARDLVEAAVRTGRTAEAEAHVAAMRRIDLFRLSPRLALLAGGSAALLASDDEADRLYRHALAHSGTHFPFERARVQLSYGEHLRRRRAIQDARRQLTEALEVFRRLEAAPWMARTLHELHISGLAHRAPAENGRWDTLTEQEHTIASLAASGLSNKQIGSHLYLSPRTVSGHLYRIFPKLGVSSRAALRDALLSAEQGRSPVDGPLSAVI